MIVAAGAGVARSVLLACSVALVLFGWAMGSGDVSAQDTDLLSSDLCRVNPTAEECICRDYRKMSSTPKHRDAEGNPVGEGIKKVGPGQWVADSEDDLLFMPNVEYPRLCARAFFDENLRRLWYFAVSFGGGLLVITLAWSGVVRMQELALGGGQPYERSQAMLTIFRGFTGIVLLGVAFVVWDSVSGRLDFLFGFDVWGAEAPDIYKYFRVR